MKLGQFDPKVDGGLDVSFYFYFTGNLKLNLTQIMCVCVRHQQPVCMCSRAVEGIVLVDYNQNYVRTMKVIFIHIFDKLLKMNVHL